MYLIDEKSSISPPVSTRPKPSRKRLSTRSQKSSPIKRPRTKVEKKPFVDTNEKVDGMSLVRSKGILCKMTVELLGIITCIIRFE